MLKIGVTESGIDRKAESSALQGPRVLALRGHSSCVTTKTSGRGLRHPGKNYGLLSETTRQISSDKALVDGGNFISGSVPGIGPAGPVRLRSTVPSRRKGVFFAEVTVTTQLRSPIATKRASMSGWSGGEKAKRLKARTSGNICAGPGEIVGRKPIGERHLEPCPVPTCSDFCR
jgi:hypothetical protein